MAQGGRTGIRAKFADALDQLDSTTAKKDPHPGDVEGWGYDAGGWTGAPADKLPPNCPVEPLGHAKGLYFFFDSARQLNTVSRGEFSKKVLLDLFGLRPYFLDHHWPRWGKSDGGAQARMDGVNVDDCIKCLMAQAQQAGVFDVSQKVRGRGMWLTDSGQLVWHSGAQIYTVAGKKLQATGPGVIENMVYPAEAAVLTPWNAPVTPKDSPVHELLATLQTWSWERPVLDPILVLGWLGCAWLGAALPWRPTLFISGDKRVGKSTMQELLRAVFDKGIIKAANTTAAGIYQRVKQDSLPVSIDELEAKAGDGKRTGSIIELARLAASGDDMLRGGAEHQGVSFTLRNTFSFSAINPPAMEPADRQRMIFLNLHKLKAAKAPGDLALPAEAGRMILRAVMDAWPRFDATWRFWRKALTDAGFEDRGTYSVTLAVAQLLLGEEAMEAAGLPIADEGNAVGRMVAAATAEERAEHGENWSDCVTQILGFVIENWKAGEKSTVGHALELAESTAHDEGVLRSQLALVGLGFKRGEDNRLLLAVPTKTSPLLAKVFGGTKWEGGVWGNALKQAPGDVVIRDKGNEQVLKINRVATRCLLVDLKRFDEVME